MKTIKAKVHMLPTEDFGCIYKRSSELTIHEPRLHKGEWTPQNLYITTDEEIKEGDWYIHPDATVPQNNFSFVYIDCRKIIATTDPKILGKSKITETKKAITHSIFPSIPHSFIEEYCKAGGIDEVLVEVELPFSTKQELISGNLHRAKESDFVLRLNSDNTIIIHPVEEKMYSRDEVIKIIQSFDGAKFASDHMEKEFDRDKWIEENL